MSDIPAGAEHASLPSDLFSTASDKLLLLGARCGEEGALAALYDRYGGLVFTLAMHVVGDPARAEDVLQDVFLHCWHGQDQFDDQRESFVTWLLGITKRHATAADGEYQRELPTQAQTDEPLPRSVEPALPPDGARERLLERARIGREPPAPSADSARAEDSAVSPAAHDARAPSMVQADQTAPTRASLEPIPVSRPTQRPRRRRIRLASLGWAAALLFVLASGLFVGAWSTTGPHASLSVEVQARLPGGRILPLEGTGAPAARARLYVLPGGQTAELAVDRLPPLRDGRVYQLWFAEQGSLSRTGGAFTVDARGDAVIRVTVPVPLEQLDTVAVTEEAAPGSPEPTGPHLLDWALR